MVTLIDKLEEISRELFDKESEYLYQLNHSESNYYGTISRKLIRLSQQRAVIKEAINHIIASTRHYNSCPSIIELINKAKNNHANS